MEPTEELKNSIAQKCGRHQGAVALNSEFEFHIYPGNTCQTKDNYCRGISIAGLVRKIFQQRRSTVDALGPDTIS